jgi:hypothetical protein
MVVSMMAGMVWHGVCRASPGVNPGMVMISDVRWVYLTRRVRLERAGE